jgi:hypothetical protein
MLQKPEGKQHGKIDPILGFHQWRYPGICHFARILEIITNHYHTFAVLFMQLGSLLSGALPCTFLRHHLLFHLPMAAPKIPLKLWIYSKANSIRATPIFVADHRLTVSSSDPKFAQPKPDNSGRKTATLAGAVLTGINPAR